MTAPKYPEVRQCTDTNDAQFGCVCIPGTGTHQGLWLVSNPVIGCHWAKDPEVANWVTLAAPASIVE